MDQIIINIEDGQELITIQTTEIQDNISIYPIDSPDIVHINIPSSLPENYTFNVTDQVEDITIQIIEIAAGPTGPTGPSGTTPILTCNIPVTNISDSVIIEHTLNSLKIAVFFFNQNGREEKNIDWEIIDTTHIKIYLSVLDDETAGFSGDIFIIDRN